MKKICIFISLLMIYTSLVSFIKQPKPHLIVGNWEIVEIKKNILEIDEDRFSIKSLYFSSDELSSTISMTNLKNKNNTDNEIEKDVAFKVYEYDDELKSPVLVLKNFCNQKSILVFSILHLDKKSLKIKFEQSYSSENVNINSEIIEFEKTAGPEENW